jgi:hypothetical protein
VVVGSILVSVASLPSPSFGGGGHGVTPDGRVIGGASCNQELRQLGPTTHQRSLVSQGGQAGFQDLQPVWVPIMSQDMSTMVDTQPSQDPMLQEAVLQLLEVRQHTVLHDSHYLEAQIAWWVTLSFARRVEDSYLTLTGRAAMPR